MGKIMGRGTPAFPLEIFRLKEYSEWLSKN
jgi:hypothetical protein